MSHSTVLVIGPDPEEQLVPFDENTSVDPYWKTEHTGDAIKHWVAKSWIEEGKLPTDPTLEQLAEALQKNWGEDEGAYRYNTETQAIEQQSTYNPKSKWDWYAIGGRWRGFYAVKAPTPLTDKYTPTLGESGAFGNTPRFHADQLLKGQIDYEYMRDIAVRDVLVSYEKVVAATKHLAGPPKTWDEVRKEHTKELDEREFSDLSDYEKEAYRARVDKARVAYRNDPWQKAIDKALDHYWGDAVEDFYLNEPDGRQKLIDATRDAVGTTFAVLKDGEWYEKGDMGWFGMVADEKAPDDWNKQFVKLIDDLPDDTLFTIVDVHI